jgi:hypothetical protein
MRTAGSRRPALRHRHRPRPMHRRHDTCRTAMLCAYCSLPMPLSKLAVRTLVVRLSAAAAEHSLGAGALLRMAMHSVSPCPIFQLFILCTCFRIIFHNAAPAERLSSGRKQGGAT